MLGTHGRCRAEELIGHPMHFEGAVRDTVVDALQQCWAKVQNPQGVSQSWAQCREEWVGGHSRDPRCHLLSLQTMQAEEHP
eukprot:619440-Amphidinium_carterae.3